MVIVYKVETSFSFDRWKLIFAETNIYTRIKVADTLLNSFKKEKENEVFN